MIKLRIKCSRFLAIIFNIFLPVKTFITVNHIQNNESFSTGDYIMNVRSTQVYSGDEKTDMDILMAVKPVLDGFNLTFHVQKSMITVNPFANHLVIEVKKRNEHVSKLASFEIELIGGELGDISMDEVREGYDIVTIMRLRFV